MEVNSFYSGSQRHSNRQIVAPVVSPWLHSVHSSPGCVLTHWSILSTWWFTGCYGHVLAHSDCQKPLIHAEAKESVHCIYCWTCGHQQHTHWVYIKYPTYDMSTSRQCTRWICHESLLSSRLGIINFVCVWATGSSFPFQCLFSMLTRWEVWCYWCRVANLSIVTYPSTSTVQLKMNTSV